MKKKIIKFSLCLVILGLISIMIVGFYKCYKINTLVEQQNYMSSRLIEMGDYEQGRILAAQSNQIKDNDVSRELLILTAGFQSDYESGIRYAEEFLKTESDEIIKSALILYQDFLKNYEELSFDDEMLYQEEKETLKRRVFEELMTLLFQTENKIKIKIDEESLQAMIDVMSSTTVPDMEAFKLIEENNSVLSQKIQVSYALQNGNYSSAYEKGEELFKESGIFENRTLLANITAVSGEYQTNSIETNDDIFMNEATQKAINFIETTTPLAERNTTAYNLELSYLYYQAEQEEKAKELLAETLTNADEGQETMDFIFKDFVQVYRMANGIIEKPDYMEDDELQMESTWKQIAQILNLLEEKSYDYTQNETFYDFVVETMNGIYNGVIIREINVQNFPTVRVTVNVAIEGEENLQKSNFMLKDMNAEVTDFSLLNSEEIEDGDKISVVLVVDHSGSMSGEPLENTKKAVSSFVKSINKDTRLGLVIFDDTSEVAASITENANSVLKEIQTIQEGGGTSIYMGLQEAGNELASESGRKIIILLSDGEDGNKDKIDEVLEELNRKNIYVYTIGFGGADAEYLAYIANSCRGKFIQAQTSDMLGEIYSTVGAYMINDYILEFEAVVDLEKYARQLYISVNESRSFAESDYHVGVSYEEIREEESKKPLADYFKEVGGSRMDLE